MKKRKNDGLVGMETRISMHKKKMACFGTIFWLRSAAVFRNRSRRKMLQYLFRSTRPKSVFWGGE